MLTQTLKSIATVPPAGVASPWQIHEVLIIDNDQVPSARTATEELTAGGFPYPLRYLHEATPGLAAARNRALDDATGDVLVFIDDDELAGDNWPGGLVETMTSTNAALVGGPVRTVFSDQPPDWAGELFERPEPAEGTPQTWLRSGNLAIDLARIRAAAIRFDPDFAHSGGEDVAFSWAARMKGLGLAWSSTAIVSEQVGPERTTMRWVTRRELRSTANWVRVELRYHPSFRRRGLVAARGVVRLGQGLVMALLGAVTRRKNRTVGGLVLAARGVGAFQGLANHAGSGYGNG